MASTHQTWLENPGHGAFRFFKITEVTGAFVSQPCLIRGGSSDYTAIPFWVQRSFWPMAGLSGFGVRCRTEQRSESRNGFAGSMIVVWGFPWGNLGLGELIKEFWLLWGTSMLTLLHGWTSFMVWKGLVLSSPVINYPWKSEGPIFGTCWILKILKRPNQWKAFPISTQR